MKVLFATDGAKQSDSAIDAFRQIALNDGDEIKIVSVIDVGAPVAVDIYGGYLPDTTELEKTAKENSEKILGKTADRLREICDDKKIDITTEMLFGSPESRIVETADEWKPDLVVVGSHGYSGWERLLIGSVSDSVVHHAPCSVLVVRTPRN
ncbi:MAG TPA: universal stress protein [Pyrinomonadaceae bacterium]|jgi:nucleotide-binding universal stress UspA family protein|nr:universal stress protein [Pyrinomonadaceae bacterium]